MRGPIRLLALTLGLGFVLVACDEIVGINPHELFPEGGVDGAPSGSSSGGTTDGSPGNLDSDAG